MTKPKELINIFWFRRDLRFYDNKGLFHALSAEKPVLPLFIFDDDIIDKLPRNDHRVSFIYDTLSGLYQELRDMGKGFLVKRGKPLDVFGQMLADYRVHKVYCNKDHEPYGISRDVKIKALLQDFGVGFETFLDHLIFDKDDILKSDGSPYQVFTPYSKAWKHKFASGQLTTYDSESLLDNMIGQKDIVFQERDQLGITLSGLKPPVLKLNREQISQYHHHRDFPYRDATTRLGVHLRFGTIGIRQCVLEAKNLNQVWLNELIWREFYAMIMWHYPRVVNQSFKTAYDRIQWLNNEDDFEAWKNGTTGYPMVDAGMRQLNATAYMHNRLRMVTASFLTKHLLIDWRLGEAYFAEKLFDFELSSNNGGWQWSAGTGCDSAPYFRIFNPTAQHEKFDPDSSFVRQWVPELDTASYPAPVVEHTAARNRCLQAYKQALERS